MKATDVAPVKPTPLMVTTAPACALVGVKLVIVGGLTNMNSRTLVAVPAGVLTLSGPVVAAVGTTT